MNARTPFQTSITARLVSCSVSFALMAGGLVALTGSPSLIPYALAPAIVGCFLALVLGVEDHPGAVVGLVIALPLLLFPSVALLHLFVTRWSSWSTALVAAGALPLLATLSAGRFVKKEKAPWTTAAPMNGIESATQS